ncbi:MAG: phosphopantetheine-binding protein [Bacilli bacterium]|nr:phosphopantetheine-binding protein [Bacilli bacterium]
MTEEEIFNKLIDIIKKLFNGSKVFDYEKITFESKPIENLGFSSMDLIMVSFAIESEFNIDIKDLTMSSFSTIREVVNYIMERVNVH